MQVQNLRPVTGQANLSACHVRHEEYFLFPTHKKEFFWFGLHSHTGQSYVARRKSSRLLIGLIFPTSLSCYEGSMQLTTVGLCSTELLEPGDTMPCKSIVNLIHFIQFLITNF